MYAVRLLSLAEITSNLKVHIGVGSKPKIIGFWKNGSKASISKDRLNNWLVCSRQYEQLKVWCIWKSFAFKHLIQKRYIHTLSVFYRHFFNIILLRIFVSSIRSVSAHTLNPGLVVRCRPNWYGRRFETPHPMSVWHKNSFVT